MKYFTTAKYCEVIKSSNGFLLALRKFKSKL